MKFQWASLSRAQRLFVLREISNDLLKYLDDRTDIYIYCSYYEKAEKLREHVEYIHLSGLTTKWRRHVGDTDLFRCISVILNTGISRRSSFASFFIIHETEKHYQD